MSNLLIKNGLIATLGSKNTILEKHSIIIEKDIIKSILPDDKIDKSITFSKTIDAKNKLVMPGMINTHMHLYSTFARGIALKCSPPRNFAEILENLWWHLDKTLSIEDVYYSSLIPLIGCIKSGTTTIIDHHASPNCVTGSLNTIANAYNELGLRGILAYEISDRDGKDIANKGILENISFIEQTSNNDMIKGLIGLHAMFTINDSTLEVVAKEAQRLNVGVHIHVAEDRYDKDYNIANYQLSPVQRLHKFGLTRNNSIFVHCVHIDQNDMKLIKDNNTIIVHNPQSNMNNAIGCCKLFDILDNSILTGLGTDGMTFNMFEELGVANIIHKHVHQNSNVGWCEIENIVTKNNSIIASRLFNKQIGILEENALADIIILDYDPPTPICGGNFWGHMLFGINKSKVLTTIVNGKVLMEDGQLTLPNIVESEINHKSRELAKKFWERF
ncbi:MAG: putative aminohydrolase SsnA [Cyanobacteriota bacterium]